MATFTGQVAIVTGAGVGIGREIARQLALQGASVLLNDIDPALADDATGEIEAAGGICRACAGDVSDVATIRAMVQTAVDTFGRLDMAVANAGLTLWGDFFEYEPDAFEQVVGLNLRGSFFLAQAAARQMRAQGTGGRIVLMSSVTGHQAVPYLSAYGMTKAGLEMLARALVLELSPHGITINCVAPGATLTPRNLQDDPNYAESWGRIVPTRRVATPADIANAALFLLSPQSGQITGQTIVVDGGWTAISPTPSLDFIRDKTR
ncbi:MAG TPA: SDR family NAD(P)-dependent oxidoreductase [Spirillospora sp.]|nr:SDR family NAD(P)-dependent oxidoreductase [Spirillospora sp.]